MMSKEPFPNPTNQKWKKADSASHPITSQSELKPVMYRYVATPHAHASDPPSANSPPTLQPAVTRFRLQSSDPVFRFDSTLTSCAVQQTIQFFRSVPPELARTALWISIPTENLCAAAALLNTYPCNTQIVLDPDLPPRSRNKSYL